MLTPKQPVINAVLITYIDYSITENYTQYDHSIGAYCKLVTRSCCPLDYTYTYIYIYIYICIYI